MRNIFLFIRSYSNLLTFLFLQGLSIYFIVSYNKYHEAAFGAAMNKFTGGINKQANKATYFLTLSQTNDSLVSANQNLYNKLKSDFNISDSGSKTIAIDSIHIDSIVKYRKFTYLSAKVVANSVSQQNNYIVLNGANVKYFKKNMGVVDVNNCVVGKITEVNGDYAVVMSLMHKDSHLDGKLFGSGEESGTLSWNGGTPNILSLSDIAKSSKIKVGDSIVTNISSIFPKGLLIGKVQSLKPEKTNNNFSVALKTAVNFYNIEFVYAIQSADAEPVQYILNKVKAAEIK